MIETQIWNNLVTQIPKRFSVPDFAVEVLAKSWPDVQSQYEVNTETKCLDASYVAFLEEQIELDARGAEWTQVLQNRRDQLLPYISNKVTSISVDASNGSIVIKFCPEDCRVILFEAHPIEKT